MSPTRAALEATLAADPDDPVRHAAYADLLLEEGDPRGEFVRLQLALEDPELPADRRAAMQQAADGLMNQHEAEWLGRLGWYVRALRSAYRPCRADVAWRRGWVDRLVIEGDPWPVVNAIRRCPAAKLIREIQIVNSVNLVVDESRPIFQRMVQTNVKRLSCAESGFDDAAVGELVRSGLVSQLHDLDLSKCSITDDGAYAFAWCPDVRRLKSLTLDGNLISPVGVQALAEVGVRAGPQFWDAGRGDAHV